MSEVMDRGIIGMPFDMAMCDELSRRQFYSRAQYILAQRDTLAARVAELERDAERWNYVKYQGDGTHWLNLLRVDLEDFGGNVDAAVDALIDGDALSMPNATQEPAHE